MVFEYYLWNSTKTLSEYKTEMHELLITKALELIHGPHLNKVQIHQYTIGQTVYNLLLLFTNTRSTIIF